MVLLDAALLGVVLGLLLGGRLGRLAELELRSTRLAYAGLALQLIAFPEGVLPWTTPSSIARVVWLFSYGCLILFLVRNPRVLGSPLIAMGLLCNLTAIVANGGLMPVIGGALRAAGRSYRVHNNSISLVHPRLPELVDRWAVPHWIPFGNVFSVGDVLIAAGTTLAVALALQPRGIRLPQRRLGLRKAVAGATPTADSGAVRARPSPRRGASDGSSRLGSDRPPRGEAAGVVGRRPGGNRGHARGSGLQLVNDAGGPSVTDSRRFLDR